jgi:hypothetical protein
VTVLRNSLLLRYLSLQANVVPVLMRLRYRLFRGGPNWVQKMLDRVLNRIEQSLFRLSRDFRPPVSSREPLTEVHTLLCSQHVNYFIWAATCFQWCCGSARFVIHDDGSLTEYDEHVLYKTLGSKNLEIISRSDADVLLADKLAEFPWCQKRRAYNHHGLKLLDCWLLAKSEKIIVMDSDVLFLRKDLDWWARWMTCSSLVYNEEPENYSDSAEHFGGRDALKVGFNSGLMILDRRRHLRLPELEEFCSRFFAGYYSDARRPGGDQVFYATLGTRVPSVPFDRSVRLTPLGPQMVQPEGVRAVHFHSCNKSYFAFMGIRYLLCYERQSVLRFLSGKME